MDCKHFHSNIWRCPIVYVPRTCNQLAHKLVSLAYSFDTQSNYAWFDVIPDSVQNVARSDIYIYMQ